MAASESAITTSVGESSDVHLTIWIAIELNGKGP
jgi:hypothetical protein